MTLSAVKLTPSCPRPSLLLLPSSSGCPKWMPVRNSYTHLPHTHTHTLACLPRKQYRHHHRRGAHRHGEFRALISDPWYLKPVSHVDTSGQVYLLIKQVCGCVCACVFHSLKYKSKLIKCKNFSPIRRRHPALCLTEPSPELSVMIIILLLRWRHQRPQPCSQGIVWLCCFTSTRLNSM